MSCRFSHRMYPPVGQTAKYKKRPCSSCGQPAWFRKVPTKKRRFAAFKQDGVTAKCRAAAAAREAKRKAQLQKLKDRNFDLTCTISQLRRELRELKKRKS